MAEPRQPSGGSSAAAPAGDAPAGELPFEAALDRLEAIVDRLERGELALEESLASFEEGVGLSRALSERLGAAERRVERLVLEGGELLARPFEDSGDGS
ncbi:MAG TPA: exodeoxyribonuclease VII small subunit [Myxococcota bacterium]|nr:exodeoxyribonuclease VII small subunit [Myxococcota bacterium]